MFTNTFLPHVGGVARSVLTLRGELTRRGHRVLIVSPTYDGHTSDAPGILRVPALKHVTGSDYSMPIPLSRHIRDEIDAFSPNVIHSHHPFLLGDTAMRMAASLSVPLVYTYHTRYDYYVPQASRWSDVFSRLARTLANGYANLADAVIAPSESMRDLLVDQGVRTPIRVVPTGIDTKALAAGDRAAMRRRLVVPEEDFLVGHLGRLAPEKNLDYLGRAIARFLTLRPDAAFAVCGRGPMRDALAQRLAAEAPGTRARFVDGLDRWEIASFYAAMDVFAFSSQSETQGMVVSEAMAAGTPVVALDASGVREAVGDGAGGVLLDANAPPERFAEALAAMADLPPGERARRRAAAQEAAARFSIEAMGAEATELYADLVSSGVAPDAADRSPWESAWRGLTAEVELVENLVRAVGIAVAAEPADGAR